MMIVAALIAAVSFALLACAGTFALLRAARLMRETSALIVPLRERGIVLLEKAEVATDGAQAAVARANLQLDKAESVTAAMDDLGDGMAELVGLLGRGQVTALAGAGRALAAGLHGRGPVGRAGALAFAVRRAAGMRRDRRRALSGSVPGNVMERR
jgi:Bacterial protein of unknown function (DUF948)